MKKLIASIVVALVGLYGFCFTKVAHAVADEYYTETDVGEIVLTVEACTAPSQEIVSWFPYHIYATDGDKTHIGCWNRDGEIVMVFWEEIEKPVFYDKNEFKARPNL